MIGSLSSEEAEQERRVQLSLRGGFSATIMDSLQGSSRPSRQTRHTLAPAGALDSTTPGSRAAADPMSPRSSSSSYPAKKCREHVVQEAMSATEDGRQPTFAGSSFSCSPCGRVLIAEDALKALFRPSRKRAVSPAARARPDTFASEVPRSGKPPLSDPKPADVQDSSNTSEHEPSSKGRAKDTKSAAASWAESFLGGEKDTHAQTGGRRAEGGGERMKRMELGEEQQKGRNRLPTENDARSSAHAVDLGSAPVSATLASLRIPVIATALGLRIQPFWRSGDNRVSVQGLLRNLPYSASRCFGSNDSPRCAYILVPPAPRGRSPPQALVLRCFYDGDYVGLGARGS